MPLTPEVIGNWIPTRTPGLDPPFFLQITGRDEQASADLIVDLLLRPSDPHDCFQGYANDFDTIFLLDSDRNKNRDNELYRILHHPDRPRTGKRIEIHCPDGYHNMIESIKMTDGPKLLIIDGPISDGVNPDSLKRDIDQLSIIYSDAQPEYLYDSNLIIDLDFESKHEWMHRCYSYSDDSF